MIRGFINSLSLPRLLSEYDENTEYRQGVGDVSHSFGDGRQINRNESRDDKMCLILGDAVERH